MPDAPLAYFLTFRCHGTWLHGDARGSTSRRQNGYGEPFLPPNRALERAELAMVRAMTVNPEQRVCVSSAIEETAKVRGWQLFAVNVRTNHVHLVVQGTGQPEAMLTAFKVWATRRLRAEHLAASELRLWSRHGSTRYLWNERDVEAACHYVLHMQDHEPSSE